MCMGYEYDLFCSYWPKFKFSIILLKTDACVRQLELKKELYESMMCVKKKPMYKKGRPGFLFPFTIFTLVVIKNLVHNCQIENKGSDFFWDVNSFFSAVSLSIY